MDTLTFRWLSCTRITCVAQITPAGLCILGDQMPQYFFTIRAGDEDEGTQAERAAELLRTMRRHLLMPVRSFES